MTRYRILTILLTLLFPLTVAAGELSGTASYRERIAMTPDATFYAILHDISNNSQIEIGRFESPGDAGPPYAFVIDYDDDAVTTGGRYAIKVEIILDGRGYVAAGTILEEFSTEMPKLELLMVRPGVAPAATGTDDQSGATMKDQKMPSLAAHGLALPATYTGEVRSTDTAINWYLSLWPDQSFQLKRSYNSGETVRSSLGRWSADPSADTLFLRDGAEMPLKVRKARDGLEVLDANTGEAFEGTLAADGTIAPIDLSDMLVAGMMTYMADAAVIEECLSGQRFPIEQEGDYLALETAYLKDRSGPGEPLYVMIEGGIAMREGMEGPARQTVTVDRFVRARRGITCERQLADASLQNTYWRLDELDGADFPREASQHEPHLILEIGEQQNYRAMLGCNRMRGGYATENDTLGFSPAASTMMACPPLVDAAERQFGKILTETVSYVIEGESLLLRDKTGTTRAIFTAVYF